MKQRNIEIDYHYKPLTEDTWDDFVELFGARGASSGCWCMWSRLAKKKDFIDHRGDGNKQAMKQLVVSGHITGLIGYDASTPIVWCSIARREEFPRLERTRTLKKIDDLSVWSIICLFVSRNYRRKGISRLIIQSALDYALIQGAKVIEAYPMDSAGETIAAFVETGFRSVYESLGFVEVARRGKRSILRYRWE